MTPPTDEKASAMPSDAECDEIADRVLEGLPTLAGGRDFNRALIRAGFAARVAEPVAWWVPPSGIVIVGKERPFVALDWQPLYAHPPAKREGQP